MHEYGYSKLKSVIPISPEPAWKLFNEQWSIMLLYKNNSQELVSKRKLINPPRIIFGEKQMQKRMKDIPKDSKITRSEGRPERKVPKDDESRTHAGGLSH